MCNLFNLDTRQKGDTMTASDNRFYREMGIQPDLPSVTALMALHNEAIERLRAQHKSELAGVTAALIAERKENATLRNRLGWSYKALFGAGLFMAYLVKS
jgi:hypothetical protein